MWSVRISENAQKQILLAENAVKDEIEKGQINEESFYTTKPKFSQLLSLVRFFHVLQNDPIKVSKPLYDNKSDIRIADVSGWRVLLTINTFNKQVIVQHIQESHAKQLVDTKELAYSP